MRGIIALILFGFSLCAYSEPAADRYEHDKWETLPRDIFFESEAYVSSFDGPDANDGDGRPDRWGIPEFVAYEIRRVTEIHHLAKRPVWMTDKQLFEAGIAPNDATYAVSGTEKLKEVKTDYRFVRGHMCPKATAERISEKAAYDTHTMMNCCPQLQFQNNGIWKELEEKCSAWADGYGRIWVICGPVFFDKKPSMWLGQNGEKQAAIPDALFKIVIRQDNGSFAVLAFVIPNIVVKPGALEAYLTTIARIETLTGLTFLNRITPEQQFRIKDTKATNLW